MILSIDVGIKSLALCGLELATGSILHWTVIDLVNQKQKCMLCSSKATYQMPDLQLCTRHAKKSVFPVSSSCFEQYRDKRRLSKAKLAMVAHANAADERMHQNNVDSLFSFILENRLTRIKEQSANVIPLPRIAISLNTHLNPSVSWLRRATVVVIENQIGPKAIRMKAVQALITQYMVDVGITNIVYQSSRNKLRDYDVPQKTYEERKKSCVAVTRTLLEDQEHKWRTYFENIKKKDDLADAFLQGVWYRKHCL